MSSTPKSNPDWSRPTAEPDRRRVAVLIPCHNEELTIAGVVRDFRVQLPAAMIVVCDNDSSDRTRALAEGEGASVIFEKRRGKGYAIQTLFSLVDADIYVMVDGDGTYPAAEVGRLIAPVLKSGAEMVVGSRLHAESNSAFRSVNKAGNKIFVFLIGRIFGVRLTDVLSGYRAFSGIFVKSTPLFTGGFDIEVEMTMRALQRRSPIVEIPVDLVSRPEGSHSKIRIIRDGLAILRSVLSFFRDYKPLSFFGSIGVLLVLAGCVPGSIVILQFIQTGFVYRLPSAVLAVGLVLSGLINFVVGVILHTTARRFQEIDAQLRLLGESIRSERSRG